jgi:ribosomal protein S18
MKNNFDSNEELYFSWYLDQLKDKGYVNHWERNEASYEMTSPIINTYIKPMKRVEDKVLEQTILNGSSYTPDFIIYWEDKAIGIFVSKLDHTKGKIETPFICQLPELVSVIETKGEFDMGNMTRLARNNIKFVYEKHKVFINLIKLPSIFNKTFTPDRYLMTDKTFKPRKLKYKNVRTLREFITEIQK